MPKQTSTKTKNTSIVYFAPAGTASGPGPYRALENLFKKLVTKENVEKTDYVAIKVHFGERGNVRHLRPIYVHRLVELVKKVGGIPFAADTLTLYKHQRHNLFAHLDTAAGNGFTRETIGCPVLIADGLRSTGVEVAIPKPHLLEKATVAQAIYDADVLINFAHLTLHQEFPVGAALKNIGMGCVTRDTKLRIHGTGVHPNFDANKCVLCGRCLRMCPGGAFTLKGRKVRFDANLCVSCADCFGWCDGGALDIPWGADAHIVQGRAWDSARAVLSTFAPNKVFHFIVAMDVTPACDCWGFSDLPIVPDLGIFASTDPVALDLAAFDALNAAVGYPGGRLEGTPSAKAGVGKLEAIYPALDLQKYRQALKQSGLGNLNYKLVKV